MGEESPKRLPDPDDDYRQIRIGVIVALTGLVCALGVQDALSVDYTLEIGTIVPILAAILGLAGIEFVDFLKRGP